MLRHLRKTRKSSSSSTESRFDCLGLCKEKRTTESYVDRALSPATSFNKAAFIPQFICKMIKDGSLDSLPVALDMTVVMMYWNIPVLKELTEMYLDSKVFAIDNLSQEINNFVQPIIDFILAQGGDTIMLFDCSWHIIWQINDTDISSVVSLAVDVACYIQKHYSMAESKLGLQLSNVIGIATGELKVLFVGEPNKRILWSKMGSVVSECLVATTLCESGKVVLAPSAWAIISRNQSHFTVETLKDGYVQLAKSDGFPVWKSNELIDERRELMEFVQNNCLPKVMACIHPLATAANTVQQLEILSSMAQICAGIVFVKCVTITPALFQSIMMAIYDIVCHYEGLLTKLMHEDVIDQGSIFAMLFGYLGYKHLDDSVRCLYFSNDVVNALKEMGLFAVARFVTGTCFAGILGSCDRMEAAVFGKAVSSAIQLASQFLDIPIVCCINTVLRARREVGDIFRQLKQRTRGSKNIPVCFEVNFSQSTPELTVHCIGRDIEKDIMRQALSELSSGVKKSSPYLPLIIVLGAVGIGKTNFLKWTALQAGKLGFRLKCEITNMLFEEGFEKAWYIVKDILVSNVFNSEKKIINLLGADAYKYPLHLLNQHLNTKFPAQKIPQNCTQELQKDMLVELMKGCTKGDSVLIVMDEGERIGMNTWLFLQDMLITGTACLVVAFNEPLKQFTNLPVVDYILKQQFVTITLGPLEERDVITLACHFLNVTAIHKNFVGILTEHCEGNALLLQEILLLPQLQLHMCLVGYTSIVQSTLEESFISTEDVDENMDKSNMKVCDVLDSEGLKSIYIPKGLLDVVKEHTIGLTPEEQMLTKKCACLRKRFGLYVLDAVCPEYTTKNLRISVMKLVRKNILAIGCSHVNVEELGIQESVPTTEIREEFCCHPLMFTSEVLRECISNFMPQGQKERLHLFIVSLLKDTHVVCDSCRKLTGCQILLAYSLFERDCLIPLLDFIHCHCVNFMLTIYSHIDYHLKEGHNQTSGRIKFLMKAAEIALTAGNEYPGENFLHAAEQIIDYNLCLSDENFSSVLAKAAMKRLEAQSNINLGKINEAMDGIGQSLMLLGKVFPSDYLSTLKRRKKEVIAHEKEVARCLDVGCELLIRFGKFRDAYTIIKQLQKMYLTFLKTGNSVDGFPAFVNVVKMKCMLFIAGCKIKPSRKMNKHLMGVLEVCNQRLDGSTPVDIIDMKTIIKAYHYLMASLFESDELSKASVVGSRVFQIIKIVQGSRELAKVAPILSLIYYYQKSITKCFEMLSHLQDVAQQTGDILAEALYYSIIVKAARRMDNSDIRMNKMKMIADFVESRTPNMIPTKNRNQKFWITSLIALWCSEQHLEEEFKLWHSSAMFNREGCPLTNFWSISAALNMIIINLSQVRELSYSYTSMQISTITEKINKDLNNIEEYAMQFTPIARHKIKDIRMLLQTIWIENVNVNA